MVAGDDRLDRVADSAALSHVIRAFKRYFSRMGNQLAASIAFFTMLAIVPLLMLAFSACGFVLTVIRPQWLGVVQMFVVNNLNVGPLQTQVLQIISNYMYNWRSVGVIGMWIALILGANWVANLKAAVRGMSRLDFNLSSRQRNVVVDFLINIGLVVVILLLTALTFTAIAIGTQLAEGVVAWVVVEQVWVSTGLVRGASYLISFIATTALLYLVFRLFIDERIPTLAVIRGAVAAALCWVGLQILASYLMLLFSFSEATRFFGPVIVAMLLIRLFAQTTLFWTAWIATSNQPAVARKYSPADRILQDKDTTQTVTSHWADAEADRQQRLTARGDHSDQPTPDGGEADSADSG